MIKIEKKVKDTVKIFSNAIKDKNIDLLSSLLSDTGLFEMQHSDLSTIDADKNTFINWISSELDLTEIKSVLFDQCIMCKIGNPVVLFNDGEFPRKVADSSEKSKTGLMLEIDENQITGISFCFSFVKTENPAVFEIQGAKIKCLMNDGYSFEDAYKKVFGDKEM